MITGDWVRYVAPDDIDPAYASREYAALVTEVDPLDGDTVGLWIFWPTYALLTHRPIADGAVPRDDSPTPAGDTWHPVP